MPTTADVEFLVEEAIIEQLATDAVLSTIQILHDDDSGEIVLPAVVVKASDGEEKWHNTGIMQVVVGVHLHCNADDTPPEEIRDLWDRVMQVLLWDTLATELSTLEDFHCYGVVRE